MLLYVKFPSENIWASHIGFYKKKKVGWKEKCGLLWEVLWGKKVNMIKTQDTEFSKNNKMKFLE